MHKSTRSMYTKYLPSQTEITDEEKHRQMLDSFIKYLEAPTEIGVIIYYDVMLKIGAFPTNLYESRTEMFLMEAQNLAASIPSEMLMNGEWRRQAYAYANYVNSLGDNDKFNYDQWKDNILHKRAIERCKRFLVTETIKRTERDALIDLYKKFHNLV